MFRKEVYINAELRNTNIVTYKPIWGNKTSGSRSNVAKRLWQPGVDLSVLVIANGSKQLKCVFSFYICIFVVESESYLDM